jgi:hypothetical protein
MATATQRITRRQICQTHDVEFGQTYIKATPEQESLWLPPICPHCEKELREKLLADEEVALQADEIREETNRRCAADAGRAERIREAASEDLAREATQMLAAFYAEHREERETYHDNEDWNRVAGEIEAEKKAEFVERLRSERK